MSCYCDTSFFLRPLLPNAGRAEAIETEAQVQREFGLIPLTRFIRLEVIQALRFEAWRHGNDRTRGLPPGQVEAALNLFLAQIGNDYTEIKVEWESVFGRAESLTRSTPERGWRTLDVIHVASALTG